MTLERETIIAALKHSGGDIGQAARELGASRRTLQNRMREYGLPRGQAGRRKRKLPYRRSWSGLATVGLVTLGAVGGLSLHRRFRRST